MQKANRCKHGNERKGRRTEALHFNKEGRFTAVGSQPDFDAIISLPSLTRRVADAYLDIGMHSRESVITPPKISRREGGS